MGFHDVRLPETFSKGSQFGPRFKTNIIELDSGAEQRVRRGPIAGRREYNLERGIDSLNNLLTLQEFFIARGGAENSFRVKDWSDYATNATGTLHQGDDPAVSWTDEALTLLTSTTFQLVKRYASGPTTILRDLKKIVAGTVKVGDAGGEITSGFTVDLLTGIVTFDVAPSGTVTGGCQFDVPCRFAEETEANFAIAIEAIHTGSLPEIKVIEDVEPVVVSQDFPFGGAYDHGDIAANVTISELNGRVQRIAPTTTGKKMILQNYTNLPLGGPYFFLINDGSQSVELENHLGTDVVNPFAAGARRELWLGLSGGTKTWFAL